MRRNDRRSSARRLRGVTAACIETTSHSSTWRPARWCGGVDANGSYELTSCRDPETPLRRAAHGSRPTMPAVRPASLPRAEPLVRDRAVEETRCALRRLVAAHTWRFTARGGRSSSPRAVVALRPGACQDGDAFSSPSPRGRVAARRTRWPRAAGRTQRGRQPIGLADHDPVGRTSAMRGRLQLRLVEQVHRRLGRSTGLFGRRPRRTANRSSPGPRKGAVARPRAGRSRFRSSHVTDLVSGFGSKAGRCAASRRRRTPGRSRTCAPRAA